MRKIVLVLLMLSIIAAVSIQASAPGTGPGENSKLNMISAGGGFGNSERIETGVRGSSVLVGDVPLEQAAGFNTHLPIYIQGDSAFTTANGVTGGRGTPSEPYIIAGWDIDATTAHGISIQNTNAYFIIRNVKAHSGGSTYNGVFLGSANNGAIMNVEVTGNYRGIFVWMSTRVALWKGNATSNAREGISILSSSNTNVADWNVSGNGRDGIRVFSSSLITLAGNVVSSNQGGVSLYDSSNVTAVVNNVTANSQFAIALSSSTDNLICHNNFAGASPLASDDLAHTNSWDAGYPTGGNHWSDYQGTDGDGDGIGDTSYVIDTELQIQDRYPLMGDYRDTAQPTWAPGAQVVASNVGNASLTLSWTPATDTHIVAGYRIYRNGVLGITLPGNMQTYTITGLSPSTTYSFKVEAGDEAANWSETGPSVVVVTTGAAGGGGGGGGGGGFFLL